MPDDDLSTTTTTDEAGKAGADGGQPDSGRVVPLAELQRERASRQALAAERDASRAERDAIAAERDAIAAERDAARARADAADLRETERAAKLAERDAARVAALPDDLRALVPDGLSGDALGTHLDRLAALAPARPATPGGRTSATDPAGPVVSETERQWIASHSPGLLMASPAVQRRFLDKQRGGKRP